MSKSAVTYALIDFSFLIAVTALFYYEHNGFRDQKNYISERVIVVNFWNPANYFPFEISHELPFESNTGTFKKIRLSGIEKSDSLKMIEIKEALRDFNVKREAGNGVHIMFGDSSKYGHFIEVLDYCLKERIRVYVPYKDNIWIPANENLIK